MSAVDHSTRAGCALGFGVVLVLAAACARTPLSELGVETVACDGVTCSDHGTCVVVGQGEGMPLCVCDEGYRLEGSVTCVSADSSCQGAQCAVNCIADATGGGTYDVFVPGPPLSVGRVDSAGVVLNDGSGLIIAGWATSINSAVVDRLPLAGSAFESSPPLIYPVSEHAAVHLRDRDWVVVVAGDIDGPGWTDAVQLFDVSAGTWSVLPRLPRTRNALGVAADGGCNIVVLGGSCETGRCDIGWRYIVADNRWESIAAIPTPRSNLSVVAAPDGIIYAIGGYDGSYLAVVEAYIPGEDRWESRTPMPTPRRQAAATLAPDGTILVLGGLDASGALSVVERYLPASDLWQTAPPLATARYGATAVIVGSELIVAGGADGTTYLDSTEKATLRP